MSAQVLVLIDGSDSSVAGQAINVTTAIASMNRFAAFFRIVPLLPSISGPSCSSTGLPFPEFPLARLDRYSPAERHHFPHRFLHRPREGTRHARTAFVTPVRPMGFFSASSFPISRSVFPSCV